MGSLRQKLNMRWPTFDIAATVHGAGPVGSPEMTRYRRAMPVQPYNTAARCLFNRTTATRCLLNRTVRGVIFITWAAQR